MSVLRIQFDGRVADRVIHLCELVTEAADAYDTNRTDEGKDELMSRLSILCEFAQRLDKSSSGHLSRLAREMEVLSKGAKHGATA